MHNLSLICKTLSKDIDVKNLICDRIQKGFLKLIYIGETQHHFY